MTVTVQDMLEGVLPALAEHERAEPETFPAASIAALYDAGVIAAPFPPELGGSNSSLPELVAAVEAIASASPSTALIACMPLGLAGIYGLGPPIAPQKYRAAFAEQIEHVAEDYVASAFTPPATRRRALAARLRPLRLSRAEAKAERSPCPVRRSWRLRVAMRPRFSPPPK